MTEFVLVHSPVTGPSTWRWVAAELAARGHRVCVPAAGGVSCWQEFADAVAAQAAGRSDAVLVGHSGAGPLLPQIAARNGARALVFVDADIPPDRGDVELMPADILDHLRSVAADGIVPPWSEWFGPAVMRELVPDPDRRAVITAELPRLPLSYFESRVPVPADWAWVASGYVLLSEEAYGGQAAAAEARDWPVVRLPGGHLDIVTKPRGVVAAIAEVAGAAAR